MTTHSALERAAVLTAFTHLKLRNKVRKVPHDAWSDPVARDFAMRLIGNMPILDEHIAALGGQQLEPQTLENALNEIVNAAYMRDSEIYARNVINQVALGDIDALQKAMDSRPSTVGMGGGVALSEVTHSLLAMAKEGADKESSTNIVIPNKLWHNTWGGLAAGSFHVLAADPGGGKSALVEELDLMLGHPKSGVRPGVMSLEMKKEFKMARYAQHLYGDSVGPRAILSGTADSTLLGQAMRELHEYNIFIDDTKYQRYGLVDAMYAMKDEYDVSYISVDFLQLITPFKGESRYDSVANSVLALFDFARDTNTPVIAISQMNREGRKLAERPRMTDLEGAGTIEQLAWTVNFLWDKNRIAATKGSTHRTWVLDKNRNGPAPLEVGEFRFDGDRMKLEI